jgi:hypothetical protein
MFKKSYHIFHVNLKTLLTRVPVLIWPGFRVGHGSGMDLEVGSGSGLYHTGSETLSG